jgi:hypothetical protein
MAVLNGINGITNGERQSLVAHLAPECASMLTRGLGVDSVLNLGDNPTRTVVQPANSARTTFRFFQSYAFL